jgi:hypothetical protein
MGLTLRAALALLACAALPGVDCLGTEPVPQDLIGKVKQTEQRAGFHPTRNFAHADPRRRAYYRCYFTGPLELPASYAGLKLRQGSPDGCALDARKHDVFFYPIEVVASGHAPITQALAQAPADRLVTVVSHEDFHEQIRDLPDAIGEAAATLAGFLTGAAAWPGPELNAEAEIFLRKAILINRYYDRLRAVYQAVHRGAISKSSALLQKREVFRALQEECAAIHPEPRSFNKCVAAANNAGLAFDHTYTEYYPLMYGVLRACRHDLRCTVGAILRAPKKTSEAAAARYFAAFAGAPPSSP